MALDSVHRLEIKGRVVEIRKAADSCQWRDIDCMRHESVEWTGQNEAALLKDLARGHGGDNAENISHVTGGCTRK